MTNSPKLYCLPGLGLDDRILDRLHFDGWETQFLNWLEPSVNEDLQSYAHRMAEAIDDPRPVILIGYSFGGIVAQEIAAIRPVSKIILLSSIKSGEELSPLFKRVARWGLQRLFNKRVVLASLRPWGWSHGLHRAETAFFKHMLQRHSQYYFRWALVCISQWERPPRPASTDVIHIHGTRDRPFPFQYLGPVDHVVQEGDHLMIYKRSNEIQGLILKELP